jgi:DDE_Tnp_1-associated/Transposase DDE domain
VVPAATASLLEYLAQVPDPRGRQGRRFSFSAMLATVVCGLMAGARGFEAIEAWIHAQPREVWWRLGYYRTPPCANAFRNLLLRVCPQALEAAVRRWTQAVLGELPSGDGLQAVALDGKSLCGTLSAHGRTVHLLALLDQRSGCVLAQQAVGDKTNEIPAARELLPAVDLRRRIVTADALHCQRETAQHIIDSGGHYLLIVKDNQPELHGALQAEFAPAFSPGNGTHAAG